MIASGLASRGHDVGVMTFYPGLPALQDRLLASGVEYRQLGKRGRWDVVELIRSLLRAVQLFSPDAVYSFLPTANVLSSLLVRRHTRAAIIWGMRASSSDQPGYDWLGRVIAWAERALCMTPDMVICNSSAGYEHCRELGFDENKLGIARNIIDLEANRFNPELRTIFRANLGIGPTALVLGVAGRIDPMKGIETLLAALPAVRAAVGDFVLLVAGDGKTEFREGLRRLAVTLHVSNSVRWLGRVDDMQGFFSAVDVLCSPSCGEGTSNVIAEAMACGRMCVATRVGDSARLVGDESLIVKPHDAASLGRAIATAVRRLPTWDGEHARSRIATLLSAHTAIAETDLLLQRAVDLRKLDLAAKHKSED